MHKFTSNIPAIFNETCTMQDASAQNLDLSGNLDVSGNTTIGGTLSVTGNETVGGTLSVTDATTLSSLSVTGNETVGGTLSVTEATALSSLYVTGNETVGGTLSVTEATTLSSLSVSGNETVGGTLSVTEATTLSSLSVSGNETVTGTLSVTEATTLSSLSVTGNVVAGTIDSGNITGRTGTTITAPTITASGNLYVGQNTNDSSTKSIFFGGGFKDNAYDHAVIENRIYSATEQSELLLFKGNDIEGSQVGPDRIRLRGANIVFDTYPGATTTRTDENIRMTILSNGNVGIGTTTPGLPLQVESKDSTGSISGVRRYVNWNGVANQQSGNVGSTNRSALFKGELWVDGLIVSNSGSSNFSDYRIKKNISDIPNSESLNMLRLLKPKKYQYIDTIEKGESYVYGFIAQEVKNILSYSITTHKYQLPNIYQLADVCNNQLILQNPFTLEYDASYQLYNTLFVYDENNILHTVEIIDISNQTISISGEITGNQMFVYGQEVDNLHVLKKDAIWTITTSAVQEIDRQLQEIDRQLQEEKIKTYTLQTQYNDLLSRITSLENNPT